MNKKQKEVQQVYLDNEKAVLRELTHAYNDSLAQINQKIELLMARQDADMQNVIYQVEHQKALKTQVQSILEQLQANEFETVSEFLASSYTDGFVGTIYDMHSQGVPLIIPIDQEQVIAAIKHDTKLSENLYTSLGKDVKLLNKQIAGEISRGIASGQGYMEITRNIANYANIPKNRAMTIARTESHRIQCKATLDAQHKAKEKGADVLKQWNAALDSDTRKNHRKLDGQLRELDEPFEVDGHKAMHPSGFGRPEEDINCRCALLQRARWALDGVELDKLKERAEYFELDKTKDFEDFKKKYLKAAEKESVLDSVQKKNIDDVPAMEAVDKKEFVPAKTIKEAQEYAKKQLGFEKVRYDDIQIDVANEINRTITDIQSKYPKIEVNRLFSENTGRYYAEMDATELHKTSGKVTEGTLRLGGSFKKKTIADIEKELQKEVEKGWLVKVDTSNIEASIWHEYGHQYANQLHGEKFIMEHPDWNTNEKAYSEYLTKCVKEQYCKNVVSEAKKAYKKEYGEKMYTFRISKYAGKSDTEAFAEAFAEYNCSKNPSKEALEIMKAAGIYKEPLENIGNSGIIEIDELTPCLRRMSDKKIINTSVVDVSPTKEEFKDWEFDWTIPQKNGYTVRAIKADGDDRIQGMIAMKADPKNYAINVDIVEAAPFNNPHNKAYVEKEYSGIGGHLFAEAVKESVVQGYDGYVYFKAKSDLVEHYQKELGAVLINPKERIMAIDERSAKVLYDKYYKDK